MGILLVRRQARQAALHCWSMKKVAVILSGCGVYDGAEIHESVLTLLALAKAGVEVECAAPDVQQYHVVNHQTGVVCEENRNVRVESARIARGAVKAVSELDVDAYDAVLLPGGFGAAKNIATLAIDGADYVVEASVAEFLTAFHQAGKPMGFACIAPAIAAKVFGSSSVRVTIGNDAGTAEALEKQGALHVNCGVEDVVIDEDKKIVTTPAYMLAMNLVELEAGIAKWVKAVLALV